MTRTSIRWGMLGLMLCSTLSLMGQIKFTMRGTSFKVDKLDGEQTRIVGAQALSEGVYTATSGTVVQVEGKVTDLFIISGEIDELDLSTAQSSLLALRMTNVGLKHLKLGGAKELIGLDLSNNNLVTKVFDFSGYSKLKTLLMKKNASTTGAEVILPKPSSLEKINWVDTRFAKVYNWSSQTKLKRFEAEATKFESIDLSNSQDLEYFRLSRSTVRGVLNLSNKPKLKEFYGYENIWEGLDLSNCPSLQKMWSRNTPAQKWINLSGNTLLAIVHCGVDHPAFWEQGGQLTELNLTGCVGLESLDCRNNQLTSLIISSDAKRFKTIDMSVNLIKLPQMYELSASLPRVEFGKLIIQDPGAQREGNESDERVVAEAKQKGWHVVDLTSVWGITKCPTVYPTEVSDYIHVKGATQTIRIYALSGTLMLETEASGEVTEIDLNHLPQGRYIVVVNGTKQSINRI